MFHCKTWHFKSQHKTLVQYNPTFGDSPYRILRIGYIFKCNSPNNNGLLHMEECGWIYQIQTKKRNTEQQLCFFSICGGKHMNMHVHMYYISVSALMEPLCWARSDLVGACESASWGLVVSAAWRSAQKERRLPLEDGSVHLCPRGGLPPSSTSPTKATQDLGLAITTLLPLPLFLPGHHTIPHTPPPIPHYNHNSLWSHGETQLSENKVFFVVFFQKTENYHKC